MKIRTFIQTLCVAHTHIYIYSSELHNPFVGSRLKRRYIYTLLFKILKEHLQYALFIYVPHTYTMYILYVPSFNVLSLFIQSILMQLNYKLINHNDAR